MTTINLWLMPNAGFESKHTIDQEISFFRDQNPSIDVRYEILSWSRAWYKIMQAVKEKSGPDVIQVGTTWISTLGYLGAIQKLDSKEIAHDRFIPTFYAMCRYFDHLWALPWFCEGRVLFYRKDILKKAGLDASSLQDWSGFRAACERFAHLRGRPQNVSPLVFSCQKEPAVLHDIAAWIWSHGGNFLSPDGKHAGLDRPESREGLEYFLDLITSNSIARNSLDQTTGEIVDNFFLHDGSAFLFSASWPLQVYLNPGSKSFVGEKKAANIGVAPVPSGPAGRFNFAGGSALAVTSFSHHPDKAWKLINFLAGKESLSRYCRNITMLPSRSDVEATLTTSGEMLQVFQGSITSSGRSFPPHPFWGSIEQIVLNGLVQTLREFKQSNYQPENFFRNIKEMNQEIEYILSVFGE